MPSAQKTERADAQPEDWLPGARGRRTTSRSEPAPRRRLTPQEAQWLPPRKRSSGKRAKPPSERKRGTRRKAAVASKTRAAKGTGSGRRTRDAVTLNRLTFDELRDLGLTINQAGRLIGAREQRGGFRSLRELDKLRGFPMETIEELKRGLAARLR